MFAGGALIKQNMYDFIKENKKHFAACHCAIIVHDYKGAVVLKYPSGFVWVLLDTDFPTRNYYQCFKTENGKSVFDHWEEGKDATPGPTLQRFLDSGEAKYVPKYKPKEHDIKLLSTIRTVI